MACRLFRCRVLHAPVSMLCGHDWNLCAPPMASNVAWPGLRPLDSCQKRDSFVFLRECGIQMVRIIKAEPASLLLELLRRQALERRLRGDWHEDGERDGAVGEVECRRAGFCDLGYVLAWSMNAGGMCTEHFPSNSKLRAEGMDMGAMVVLCLCSERWWKDFGIVAGGRDLRCGLCAGA